MRRRICILLFSTLLLTVACDPLQRQRTAAVLDDVESYINERPDSALAVLRALDTNKIHGLGKLAKYRLLRSIALDKTYCDDGSYASEIAKATVWYAAHGSDRDRMLAYYYLADQQLDGGSVAEASVNFSRALDLSRRQHDWFIAGMAARNLSNLYLSGYDYPQSELFALESVNAFMAADRPRHVLYSRLLLANAFYNMQEFERSIALCDSLIQEASYIGAEDIVMDALSISAKAYINQEPPMQDSTLARFNRIKEHTPLSASQLAIYAWALCLNGQVSEAQGIVREAYSISTTASDSSRVMPWEVRIAEKSGDIVRANHLLHVMQEYIDEQLHQSISQSVEKARAQYYHEQQVILAEQIRDERRIVSLVILVISLLAGMGVILYRRRIRRSQHENARLQQLVETVNRQIARADEKQTALRQQLDILFQDYFSTLGKICADYKEGQLDKNQVSDRAVLRRLDLIIRDFTGKGGDHEEFERLLDKHLNHVMSDFRRDFPKMRAQAYYLVGYIFAGLDMQTIGVLMGVDIDALYARKHRIKSEITKSSSPEKSRYLELFH